MMIKKNIKFKKMNKLEYKVFVLKLQLLSKSLIQGK